MHHQSRSIRVALATLFACLAAGVAGAAPPAPATVTVFSAGSLRGVVGELAEQAQARYGIRIDATFGGSGALRARIEHGAHADLLLSADVASPAKLAAAGRTVVPALPFARNRICVVAPRAADVTPGNFVERVLAKGTRVWTSTPVVDPGGDYAAAILAKISAQHPAAGATLAARAQAVRDATAKAPGEGLARFAGLFQRHQIDLLITYCSGAPTLLKQAPELASFELPASLDPHPVYGMAVLSDTPAALRVALFLLSPAGQAILTGNGFVAITAP